MICLSVVQVLRKIQGWMRMELKVWRVKEAWNYCYEDLKREKESWPGKQKRSGGTACSTDFRNIKYNLRFFYFTMVWNQYELSRKCTLNFEFGSFSRLVIYPTIFPHDAGQGQQAAAPSLPYAIIRIIADTPITILCPDSHSVFHF